MGQGWARSARLRACLCASQSTVIAPVCVRDPLVCELLWTIAVSPCCGRTVGSRMKTLERFGLEDPVLDARESDFARSKLQRRLALIAYETKELDMRPVAEIRAEWLRRAAEASRREVVDPRLHAENSIAE